MMVTHTRKNQNVCSYATTVTLEDEVIRKVEVEGGCDGNLKGVCALLEGQQAGEAIRRIGGILCGGKPSSCPQQIALCLQEAIGMQKQQGE